jgi:hypothetical protein
LQSLRDILLPVPWLIEFRISPVTRIRRLYPKPAYQERHCNRYVENSGHPLQCRQYAGFPAKRHYIAVSIVESVIRLKYSRLVSRSGGRLPI